ncbi:hypothetical protein ACA910_021894 [Epithemia clementina (nom. ined.)]
MSGNMRVLFVFFFCLASSFFSKDCAHVGVLAFSSLSTCGSTTGRFRAASTTTLQLPTPGTSSLLASTTADIVDEDQDTATTRTGKGLFKRDRYIATNRFSVRKNQQPKFEQRWATRKSKLAQLEGFQYFHLMRRVTLNENDDGTSTTYLGGETDDEAFENYVSFTIWNKKSHFSAWRSGEAFKEAHGGTSIGAFLSTMLNSARVLRGAPRPAFYDGLFLQKSKPTSLPEVVDGWRNVQADGIHTLPPECFVTMQKFYIPSDDRALEFEQYWSDHFMKESMQQTPGFVARSVMRRDGLAKGHGIVQMQSSEPTYVIVTIFQDLASYQAWNKGSSGASSSSPELPASFSAERPPETVYYEGTLVISSPEGA